MARTKIPKCMSTQHPDNVNMPFFSESNILGGEDEIQEAYYAMSHLGCDEQMWDCEGKEVDDFVVKKLLTKYESFFTEQTLGKDVHITLRVPNPTVEKAEAKILLETLESIPRSYDVAKLFYKRDIAPIFEVILPMTSSVKDINRIFHYYTDYVVGKEDKPVYKGDIRISEWIGEFKPERINVIPLFEDKEHMLLAHKITAEYLADKDIDQQRVFLARSDPAMNYGLVPAMLLNKIALGNLHTLSRETGVRIYPIVGVGSAPFRGNLRPDTADHVARDYPSIHTFTIQSAFKYDNNPEDAREGIKKLAERKTSRPRGIDTDTCMEIIDRYSHEYQRQITSLAKTINKVARYVPNRRRRKLHVGLYGYSRSMGEVSLPRAISFTAALYSMGLPPELLGLNALTAEDLDYIGMNCAGFEQTMRDAIQYFNPDSPFIPEELGPGINILNDRLDYETNKRHRKVTDQIISCLRKNRDEQITELVLRGGNIRGFLG